MIPKDSTGYPGSTGNSTRICYGDARLPPRFWEKVDVGPGDDPCWIWSGAPTPKGYGRVGFGSPIERGEHAHRRAYRLLVEPIPDGMEIDHRCRQKMCCNPGHLDVVTPTENNRRSHLSRMFRRGKSSEPPAHEVPGMYRWRGKWRLL